RMKAMGDTLIDVNVMSRVVSLQVHNDHPGTAVLLSAAKPEVEAALDALGYSFISLKHLPYPSRQEQHVGDAANEPPSLAVPSITSASYRGKPYKGVDMRV